MAGPNPRHTVSGPTMRALVYAPDARVTVSDTDVLLAGNFRQWLNHVTELLP